MRLVIIKNYCIEILEMSKSKKNIIKFFVTKEDKKKSIKEIKSMNSSDESDDDELEEDEQPTKIIERIVDKDTEIVTSDNIISKTFTYEEADVLVIKDKNGDYWYRGKDLATLLCYVDCKKAISRHVDEEYKKSLADIEGTFCTPQKIDQKTVFCDDSGFIQLISRSKKPEAMSLWRKITKEILPTLFRTGTYTLPAKDSDIEKLNQSFYDDNMLSKFIGSPCLYFGYVGKHKVVINGKTKEEHIIKFGETRKMEERDLKQHRKFYKTFNVLGIWKTLANVEVEKRIEANFQSLNMLVDLKIKGINKTKEENRREHIILTEKHGLDYCLNMIEQVVSETKLPQENEYINKIKELEYKNTLQSEKINTLIK